MPFQVKCGNCGAILYESPNDIPGIAYLTRRNNQKLPLKSQESPPITLFIRAKVGTHCPKCGERLARVPREVKVIPVMKET